VSVHVYTPRAGSFPENGRGRSNYLDLLAAEIQRTADPEAMPPVEDVPLCQYALLLLAKGVDVMAEDVTNPGLSGRQNTTLRAAE
jgi:hypothetical protein